MMVNDSVRNAGQRAESHSAPRVRSWTTGHANRRLAWPIGSRNAVAGCGAFLAALLGCAGGTDDSEERVSQATSRPDSVDAAPNTPPVAAIDSHLPRTESDTIPATAIPGSPEALLVEITRLVASNENAVRQQAAEASQGIAEQPTASPRAELSNEYRRRLEQVIELATEVVTVTHLQPEQEQQFNNAVHYLSNARLELATAGDEVQGQLLVEDADSLFARDPDSFAASEAGFKVVELARRMADALGVHDADWIRGYANQAVLYSQRFPNQGARAAMSLFTAGRMCDHADQPSDALRCLQLLREQHADSVFAEQSAGFLRRLTLPGQALELAGPSIDGGFVDIQQYAGRIVLVVFWTSTSETFQQHLPLLQRIENQLASRGLAILGVNLDNDEAAVDQFLTTHAIAWPHVFSSDPNQRGGRNPVARYYSVQRVPAYWLVDRSGKVVSALTNVSDLLPKVQELINRR